MKRALLAMLIALAVGVTPLASADAPRDPCAKRHHRGPAIDLDVKQAELHAVFRFIAEAGRANLVVANDVKGSLTIRLRNVAWELALCTVARSKSLVVSEQRGIYTIRSR